jgi:hypothetical protein
MMERPSMRLRMGMLYTIAVFARADDSATYDRAARSLVSLAVEQRNPRMMVFGALILNQHPGFPAISGAASALTRALELLPEEEHSLRASALSALAISAPVGFTEESYALSDEAVRIARAFGTVGGRYVALLNQLYLYGGPAHGDKPTALAREVELLAHQNAPLMPMLPVDVALLRAVAALQRAELGTVRSIIDRATVRCRAVRNSELLWHVSRFRALSRINQGAFAQGAAQLEVLHRQAEAQSLFGTGPFCAFDRAVSLRALRGTPALDARLREGLDYDAAAPPSIWSMKLRALTALGLLEDARSSLRAVPTPKALERLPCDAYYLGTLGHLAHATVRLRELAYVEMIHALLAPYEAYFAVQLSFYCEGAVPQLRGMLARALGRHDEAVRSLERGVEMSEHAGFLPSAAEARFELAHCLHERARAGDRDRARQLSEEVEGQAIRLAMHRLARKASALRQLLGGATPSVASERGTQTGSMR